MGGRASHARERINACEAQAGTPPCAALGAPARRWSYPKPNANPNLLDDGSHAEDTHADLLVIHDVAGVRPRRDEPAASLDADAVLHHRGLRDEGTRVLLVEAVAVPARGVLEAEGLRA